MSSKLEDELIVGEVIEVGEFGATLKSDEYEGELFLHVSGLPVRKETKVSDVIKVGQILVVRVLKEDKKNKRLYVSIKGIDKAKAKTTLRKWKERRKIISLIERALEETQQPTELIEKIEERAISKYGSLNQAFKAALEDEEVLSKIGIPKPTIKTLSELIRKELFTRVFLSRKEVEILFLDKDALSKLHEVGRKVEEESREGTKVTVRVTSPPKYELVVESNRPKEVKNTLERALRTLEETVKNLGGIVVV